MEGSLNILLENHRAFLRFLEQKVGDRALETFAREMDSAEAPQPDLEAEICACIGRLTATLKPEYTDVLMAIDVHGQPGQGARAGARADGHQRRRARLSCARGSQETRPGVLRRLRRTWV